jgi:hypothetical protein
VITNMIPEKIWTRQWPVVIGAFLLFTQLSSAAITSCGGSSINTITSTAGETPAGGCGAVDLGFNNFTVTGGVTSSNIDLTASGGTIAAGPPATITPIGLTLTSSSWVVTSGNTLTSSVQFLDQVIAPPGGTGTPTPGSSWAVDGVGLLLPSSGIALPDSADSITVTEQFCLGVSAVGGCDAATNAGEIVATIKSSGTTITTTCPTNLTCSGITGASGVGETFTSTSYSSVYVNQTVTVTSVGGGGFVYIPTITDSFFQDDPSPSPEPSTFFLLGSALVMLALVRRYGKTAGASR